jgi:sulfhydrogenase subunit beta (sulfur reductase)
MRAFRNPVGPRYRCRHALDRRSFGRTGREGERKLTSEGKEQAMRAVLEPEALEAIVTTLRGRDWRVIAPKISNKAIVLDEIASTAELPIGWKDIQAPGSYRLERRDDESRFGYAVGPQSWKRELLAPEVRLLQIQRSNGGFTAAKPEPESRRTAFFGVRPCELAAIQIQDRVLIGGSFADEDYLSRRQRSFIVAVNCGAPAGNCFCASMGTGPKAENGYDLVLTEILEGKHRFLAEAGTEEGAELLAGLPHEEAAATDAAAADKVTDAAREKMGITLDRSDVHELLLSNLEHPRYDEVSARCLQCTNCTLACPTCFCTTIDDVNDLSGNGAERVRRWDSCFTLQYSEMHGGGTRRSPQSRYRQWLTHKLSTWQDQFDTLGCVGCGRCITWCPVGIDIREEVAAIRATQEEKS